MMRAWRTDSVEGRPAAPEARARMRTGEEGRPGRARMAGLRGLGATLARAGRAAWARSMGRRPVDFEGALHGFTAELSASKAPEAIEAALIHLAGRIAPDGRFELVRATGERSRGQGLGDFEDIGPGREGLDFEEFRLRCGAADHGVLRIHHPEAAARPETWRRLSMACTLAACALESARLQAEWTWAGDGEDDGLFAAEAGEAEAEMREPHRPRGVVRDATFLNAVLPFALEQSRRHGEPVSIVCVQLDRRGAIRDLLGAAHADRLVYELGEIVGSVIRTSDLVARLDDDRIVALLVRARGENAMKVARSIGHAVAESGLGAPYLPGTSVSIGVAEFPATARDAASLLDAADEAMTIARVNGSHSPVLAGTRPAPGHVRAHAQPHAPARTAEMAACGR